MRKNHLPFGLINACLGILMLSLSALTMYGQPGIPDHDKLDDARFQSIRANQQTGIVNPSDVYNALNQADLLRSKSTGGAMGLNWVTAGPDNYPGLVRSAIFDNTDASSSTIIAGSESGGVWKSTNIGLTWSLMPAQYNAVLRVSSMAQAANGDIYAATGITSCKSLNWPGTGIYKYANGGEFTLIPATQSNPDFIAVTKLAIAPSSGRIFAATYGGLYYSDNGEQWTKVKTGYAMDVCVGSDGTVIAAVGDSAYLSEGGNLASWVTLTTGKTNMLPKSGIGWMSFAIAPSDNNVMYASFAGTDGKLLNVYTSKDKGATWSIVFPNNPTFDPFGTGGGCYANTLAVFPDDPGKIYLGGGSMWLGQKVQETGFYNWEVLSSGLYSPWYSNSAPANHHSYMFRPNNHSQLVLATDGGVCLATNTVDGMTFQTSNKNLESSQFYSVAYSCKRDFVMGGGKNIGSLAMGYFYPKYTSDTKDGWPVYQPLGLFAGTNGGTCAWSNLNYNIGVFTSRGTTSVINRHDFQDLTYANDFMMGITSVYPDYSPMTLWESFTFNQTRDSVKFIAYAHAIPADTTMQIASANGINFPYHFTSTLPKGDSIVIADPIASRYFFYGNKAQVNYGYGVYMTKDMLKFSKDPEYFIVLKDTATKVDFISAIAISSDLNTLWAGTKKGRLIRVTGLVNAHDSVTANEYSSGSVLVKAIFTNTPFTGRNVTSLSINPANSNLVMVTLGNYGNSNYVYYATNANAAAPAFSSIQSNLPTAPVYSGLLELHGNNAIIGTDVGVWSTNNLNSGNPTWAPDMQNIGNVVVTDIKQQIMHDYHILNYGLVYMSTYGRGIWMDTTYYAPVGIEPVIASSVLNQLTINPNPASDLVNIAFTHVASGNVEVSVCDLTGRQVLIHNFGYHAKGTFNGVLNIENLPAGCYIISTGSASGKLIIK